MAKKLLKEAVVRRFQKLANVAPINEMYNNEEQEQENNFGIEPAIPWEVLQDTYADSVALLRLAFQKKGIVNEESLQQLALWLVRSRAGQTFKSRWSEWGYEREKEARAAWKRANVLKNEVDYTQFLVKLRRFLFEPTPAWKSR